MRAVIIAGGEEMKKSSAPKIEADDFLICADRGLNYADNCGLYPDLIVGDMDSVNHIILDKYKDVEQIRFKAEKDFSDSELAVSIAIERGYKTIILLSAIGSRIDHSLANIMLIQKYYNLGVEIEIYTNNSKIQILKDHNKFSELKYNFFTIIPLTRKLLGVNIFNAKYELRDRIVNLGDTLCLSNEPLGDDLIISKKEGNAILIFTNDN